MADATGTRANGRDNLMKMLLSSGTTMPISSNVSSILPASPSGEYSDDNANRLGAYLHRIAGYSDVEIDAVVKDHSYAKPWNWKPDNIYVKPVKKLFFTKSPNYISDKLNVDREIDVESIEVEDKSLPFDLLRSRHHMDEFQRLANFVRPEKDTDYDWEEKIEKISWSQTQHRIFSTVMKILSSERLARLVKMNSFTEPIFRRNSVDKSARRFRDALAFAGWEWKTTQWLHSLLFEHLPREYLAIYLDILQTLRQKIPQLIDRMMATQPNINSKVGAISSETISSLLKRSWDPFATCLNSNRAKKLPGNPILIIAPSSIGTNGSFRQHKWIAQLGSLGMVVNVHMHQGLAASRMTMMVCMEQLIQATRAKIQDVRVDCPGRPIILVGFNSGAATACQVAQMEQITAVICMGFPFTTVEGKRGTPDDILMDIRCPVMFVIGENACLVRPDDLEYIREKMLVETSLVVVGSADDHLRISTRKKITEGITQCMVDRCILGEIGDFVASILLQPHPLPPRPFSLTSSNYPDVKEKIVKKDARKRKTSTCSSVDSETTASPNVKKTRPGTPVTTASNQTSTMSVAPRFVPLAVQSAGFITGTGGISSNPGTPIINNSQAPVQKRRSRVTNNTQKHHYSDHMVSSKHMTQHASSTSNGGITLNIGSLASLAPIGPIRLAPSVASQSALTAAKGQSINCRSPVTLAPKMPKIMQTNTSQTTKIKTVLPTSTSSNWSKGFSKMTAANCPNINLVERGMETKSYNILNTSANQIATGSSPLAVPQNKSPGNVTTSGPLTALLQSGKNALGAMSNQIVTGRGIPSSSSNILLTPCINSSSSSSGATTGTITTSASAKVMDSSSGVASVMSDRMKIANSSMSSCPKKNILESSSSESGSSSNPAENGSVNILSNKTPATILPLSGRLKTGQRYGNSVPKITMNSNNLQKSQRGKIQTIQTIRKKNMANEVDEDLGNILDIPIIFAKDGDNLNIIEREHFPLGQIHRTNTKIDNTDIKPKRLGSTTKVVLISNKQQPDKNKTINQPGNINVKTGDLSELGQRNVAQVILHSRSENQPISLATSRTVGLGSIPLQSATRSNQPTIKYTKIILAKRNSGLLTGNANNNNNFDKSQQIILTKSATKLSVAKGFQRDGNLRPAPLIPLKISNAQELNNLDDTLEIEDAIKTNIIERKLPLNIPEIDLTSPIKKQQINELSGESNPTRISEREDHDSPQIQMDA